MKAARDLSPELWLSILSFLPPGSVHMMMGVSRNVSRLALSDKYSEIRFDGDDKKTSRIFEQLNCPNIAALVKTLHLDPSFLPGLFIEGDDAPPPILKFSWFRKLFRRFFGRDLTDAAFSALPECPNLYGISITVSDTCPLTSAFLSLLRSLPQTTASGIQKIAVCTTLARIPEILKSISKSPCQLSYLKCLDITIEKSRASLDLDGTDFAIGVIVKTINDVSATLTHLKISSAATEDDRTNLAPIFQPLGTLPSLRAFDVILDTQTLATDGGDGLTAFLNANKSDLEHLVLRPSLQPGETPLRFNDRKLLREWSAKKFTGLGFSKLHTLEIDFGLQAKDQMKALGHILEPEPVMPSSTYLRLSHAALSLADLGLALDMAAGMQLKSLHCTVKCFSPEMLDVLVTKAPYLTSLDLTYERKASREPPLPQGTATRGVHQVVGAPMGESLYDILAKRSYPKWPLLSLRIACKEVKCGGTHPDIKMARAVGDTVPQTVELDLAYHGCVCGESENSHTGSPAGR